MKVLIRVCDAHGIADESEVEIEAESESDAVYQVIYKINYYDDMQNHLIAILNEKNKKIEKLRNIAEKDMKDGI